MTSLATCTGKEACTEETTTKRATNRTTMNQEVAASDPADLTEMGSKVQDPATMAAAGGDDLAATCQALDGLIAEPSK